LDWGGGKLINYKNMGTFNRIQTANKKECPKCKSSNVVDTGSRMYLPTDGKSMSKLKNPYYICKNCGERFLFLENSNQKVKN
jgi:YgiT-type zinc finger domain-containing protein